MVYFLKFGASWVLPPGIFILALWGLAFYCWRYRGEKKIAAILAGITFIFYLLCTSLVSEQTMGWLESAYGLLPFGMCDKSNEKARRNSTARRAGTHEQTLAVKIITDKSGNAGGTA